MRIIDRLILFLNRTRLGESRYRRATRSRALLKSALCRAERRAIEFRSHCENQQFQINRLESEKRLMAERNKRTDRKLSDALEAAWHGRSVFDAVGA